jgi:hypothetical protein
MSKTKYIQTDSSTANLTELLLAKLVSIEQYQLVLNNKLCDFVTPPDTIQLYTEKETADKLKISVRTLVTLRNDKKIHYRKIESCVRYSLVDIEEFEECCRR